VASDDAASAEGDRESPVPASVPRAVRIRWPAFEALGDALRPTADLLALGLADDEIARRLGRDLSRVRRDVSAIFDRLAVRQRHEIARILHGRRASGED
jgi:DNA-binding NarL/FixJ family response regulator